MQERRYRLTVIPDRCQGHNRCHVLAPELIEIDELGFAHVKGDGLLLESQLEKARLAVRNCPEFALKLQSSETGETS
jgi:ferredoxin